MPDDKDVIVEESSNSEQEDQVESHANPEQGKEEQQDEQGNQSESPSPQPGKKAEVTEDTDDRGVPWKNRALEFERKLRETSESIPKIIEKTIAENLGKQQPQERKMSFEELEAFALEKPEYRPWAEAQKEKLREEREQTRLNDALQKVEKTKQAEIMKKESLGYVIENYPDLFLKGSNGRAVDWDNSHPMTQIVGELMRDPRFAGDPEGLIAATEIAYARHMRGQVAKTQKEVKKVTQKLKKVENQTFVEGNGKAPAQTGDVVKKSIDRLAQTGSKVDAEAAVREYLRKSGRIK